MGSGLAVRRSGSGASALQSSGGDQPRLALAVDPRDGADSTGGVLPSQESDGARPSCVRTSWHPSPNKKLQLTIAFLASLGRRLQLNFSR